MLAYHKNDAQFPNVYANTIKKNIFTSKEVAAHLVGDIMADAHDVTFRKTTKRSGNRLVN